MLFFYLPGKGVHQFNTHFKIHLLSFISAQFFLEKCNIKLVLVVSLKYLATIKHIYALGWRDWSRIRGGPWQGCHLKKKQNCICYLKGSLGGETTSWSRPVVPSFALTQFWSVFPISVSVKGTSVSISVSVKGTSVSISVSYYNFEMLRCAGSHQLMWWCCLWRAYWSHVVPAVFYFQKPAGGRAIQIQCVRKLCVLLVTSWVWFCFVWTLLHLQSSSMNCVRQTPTAHCARIGRML